MTIINAMQRSWNHRTLRKKKLIQLIDNKDFIFNV